MRSSCACCPTHCNAKRIESTALLACGAELISHTSRDGDAELRRQLGSRARVVRINGRVFSEGDIMSNARHRLGAEPDA